MKFKVGNKPKKDEEGNKQVVIIDGQVATKLKAAELTEGNEED